MPVEGNVFTRIWRFLDQFTSSQAIARSDLDVACDDLALGVTHGIDAAVQAQSDVEAERARIDGIANDVPAETIKGNAGSGPGPLTNLTAAAVLSLLGLSDATASFQKFDVLTGATGDFTYIVGGGQSNGLGADGGSNTNWITEAGKVFAWVESSQTYEDAVGLQGSAPFNTDGSNNAFVHACLEIANRTGKPVRLIMMVQGATEIEKWTGGGYRNGVPRNTDRTVSDTNRELFKKVTDAVAAAQIPQFHGLLWWHGEADNDTPHDVYLSELDFLLSEVEALGVARDSTQRFGAVMFGLYTGEDATTQRRRSASIEEFHRRNPSRVAFVPTHYLEGRDDDLSDPDNGINHFASISYKVSGKNAGAALMAIRFGATAVTDIRIEDISIKPSGLEASRIGYRSHQMDGFSGVSKAITAATQADPCVITSTAHGLVTGDRIRVFDVVGMTELNDKLYTITRIDDDSYSLDDVDATAYTAYTSGGTGEKVLELLLDDKKMLGELYPLSGNVTIQLDPNANDALGDGGRGFEFTTLSNSDRIFFRADDDDGTTRQFQLMGADGAVSTLELTGTAGIARVTYRGSRYEVELTPRNAHSTAVIQGGTNDERRMCSPLELRQAGSAAYDARHAELNQILTHEDDASVTVTDSKATVLLTGTITGARSCILSGTDRSAGEVVTVVHNSGSSFSFAVKNLTNGGATLRSLADGVTGQFVFDGTNFHSIT
jgi:hypothetical protein